MGYRLSDFNEKIVLLIIQSAPEQVIRVWVIASEGAQQGCRARKRRKPMSKVI